MDESGVNCECSQFILKIETVTLDLLIKWQQVSQRFKDTERHFPHCMLSYVIHLDDTSVKLHAKLTWYLRAGR